MAGHLHDIIAILMMSLALGMDAFSLAIGIGMVGIRRKKALELCAAIGAFHVGLTLIGLCAGILLENYLGKVAGVFGAILLIGLGLHMAYSSLFSGEDAVVPLASSTAVTLFAASVSLDAMSIGFSLGLHSAAYGLVSALSFGFFSSTLCGCGLLIGRRANGLLGTFGELVGAMILIGIGIRFFLQ